MPAEEYLTCTCQHCPGKIEFPAHAVGEKVKCPHCGMTTVLWNFIPPTDLKRFRAWFTVAAPIIVPAFFLALLLLAIVIRDPRSIDVLGYIAAGLVGLVAVGLVIYKINAEKKWIHFGILAGLAMALYFFFFFETSRPSETGRNVENIGLLNHKLSGILIGLGIAILCMIVFAASKLKPTKP